jgi:hypothetical protein
MSAVRHRAIDRAEVLARLRALEPQLRARGLRSLHLFGSTARDEANAESDIDVFVEFAPGAAIGWDFAGAPELLSRELDRKIDFTTRGSLHPLLRADIEREAIQVF